MSGSGVFVSTKGLVLRETTYKEADRILTVLTEKDGIVTAKARGALRKTSKISAGTQMMTYSDFIFVNNAGKLSVSDASVIESFDRLRADIVLLSLAAYFAECIETVLVEDQPDAAVLQLALNSLYALDNNLYSERRIKAAFELRLMCLGGYAPDVSRCSLCGSEDMTKTSFVISDGVLLCRECAGTRGVSLTAEECAAIRHIVYAPAKKLLSFSASETTEDALSYICEQYISVHTERKFASLEYYKKIKSFKI